MRDRLSLARRLPSSPWNGPIGGDFDPDRCRPTRCNFAATCTSCWATQGSGAITTLELSLATGSSSNTRSIRLSFRASGRAQHDFGRARDGLAEPRPPSPKVPRNHTMFAEAIHNMVDPIPKWAEPSSHPQFRTSRGQNSRTQPELDRHRAKSGTSQPLDKPCSSLNVWQNGSAMCVCVCVSWARPGFGQVWAG